MEDGGKKKKGKRTKKSPTPEDVYVVESIKDKKIEGGVELYFIKWKDWPETTNTWEPIENLEGCGAMLEKFNSTWNGKTKGGSPNGNAKEEKRTPGPSSAHRGEKKKPLKAKKRKPSKLSSGSELEEPTEEGPRNGIDKTKENSIDVDVLEELPHGKVPEALLGVVPIQGIMTYLIKWKAAGEVSSDDEEAKKAKAVENGEDENVDMTLVKGDVFKSSFPLCVIDFYEKNISWLRDDRSEDDVAEEMAETVFVNARIARDSLKHKAKGGGSVDQKVKKRKVDTSGSGSGSDSESSGSPKPSDYVADPDFE